MLIVPEDPSPDTIRVPVLKVFDGDGFLTRIESPRRSASLEVTIRLGFIDAPEMEQPGGEDARNFLQSLIGGRWVDLAILMKMDTGGIVDRHNRIVAVPYLKIDHQGPSSASGSIAGRLFRRMSSPAFRNIELEMVLNGWAWVLDRYEPDQRYFEALEDAQRSRRGIWAFEDNLHPWEFKKRKTRLLPLSAAARVTGLIRGFTGLARSGVNRGRFRTSFVQLPLPGSLRLAGPRDLLAAPCSPHRPQRLRLGLTGELTWPPNPPTAPPSCSIASMEGPEARWARIGAAWPNKDGKGFNILCDAVPLQGRIVMRAYTPKPKAEDGTDAETAGPAASARRAGAL